MSAAMREDGGNAFIEVRGDRFESSPAPASARFPVLPLAAGAVEQKAVPKDHSNSLISLRKIGAGEGIRTLDPNLGKVVLYP